MKTGRYYLTAKQAADALGVTRATLYAYTSRGQLRSEPVSGRPRERRYYREDVEHLKERKEARRDPARAAARGLHWGGPVMESGITLIHNGRFYYRGRDAVKLAETASAEQVAALLWARGRQAKKSGCSNNPAPDAPPIGAAAHAARGSRSFCFSPPYRSPPPTTWRRMTCARQRSGGPARGSCAC